MPEIFGVSPLVAAPVRPRSPCAHRAERVAFRSRSGGASPIALSAFAPVSRDPATKPASPGSMAYSHFHLFQPRARYNFGQFATRSEEHTSELQSLRHLVCRLL